MASDLTVALLLEEASSWLLEISQILCSLAVQMFTRQHPEKMTIPVPRRSVFELKSCYGEAQRRKERWAARVVLVGPVCGCWK